MSEIPLFHESWYRVSKLKLTLRPNIRIHRQIFGKGVWYVLHDPYSNDFYRIKPDTYTFLLNLHPQKSLDEVWNDSLEKRPESTPGQSEIIQLLSQLYQANLLLFDQAPDSSDLFKKYSKKQKQLFKSNYSNLLYLKFPIFDPDHFLNRIQSILQWIYSPIGAIIWFTLVIYALFLAVENSTQLMDQSEGLLAPSNLPALYLCMVIIKAIHEMGHATIIKRFGGEVHTIGIMLLLFNPVPYVDANASWAFRSKWHRMFVGAGGMLSEFVLAAIAMIVYANTGEGNLHSISYNVIIIASVSTLIFNINPLLKFDGYYILTDFINIPNLQHHSKQYLKYLSEKYLFGIRKLDEVTSIPKEKIYFTIYGILSSIYKAFVFISILMLIADHFFALGIIMAGFGIYKSILKPLFSLLKYLSKNPKLAKHRSRAYSVSTAIFILLFCCLFLLPFPYAFTSPGVLQATHFQVLHTQTSGGVVELLTESGRLVKVGTPLIRMQNEQLTQAILESKAAIQETEHLLRQALYQKQSDLRPLEARKIYHQNQLQKALDDQKSLLIKSTFDGVWISPQLTDLIGTNLVRGQAVGQIIDDRSFTFVSVVSQSDVAELFDGEISDIQVRLKGLANEPIQVLSIKKIPMDQNQLPSQALGWASGGDVAVDPGDRNNNTTQEPFYEVHAQIVSTQVKPLLLQGRTGRIQFDLGYKPIGLQLTRHIRQLLQKRYML